MAANNALTVERYSELPPVVREELEQLTSALQSKLAALASSGIFQDIPYDATSFATDAGTVTVNRDGLHLLRYNVIGEMMHVQVDVRSAATTGTISVFSIRLDVPYKVQHRYISQGSECTVPCIIWDGAAWANGFLIVSTSDQNSSVITLRVLNLSATQINTNGQVYVVGQISFKVAPR